MLIFTIEHKYCGYTKMIQGYNVWDAFKRNNLDLNVWMVKSVDR